MNNPGDRLIIFTRYPRPGLTKTRLIPALGPKGAADLQRRLTEGLLRRAQDLAENAGVEIEVAYTDGGLDEMRAWLGQGPRYSRQHGDDLGQCMEYALHSALDAGVRRAVLVGSDIPLLDAKVLEAAFEVLAERDAVLGPCQDGGYYLVGLSRPAPGLMKGGNWRSCRALARRAEQMGLGLGLVEELWDLDTPADLKRWQRLSGQPSD